MFRVATPVFFTLVLATQAAEPEFVTPPARVSVKELRIPQNARDKYADAERRLRKNDSAGARRLLEQAVALAPEYSAAWNALGVIAPDDALAEAHFRHAAEADADNLEAALNLGALLLRTGRAEEALPYHQRVALQLPNDAAAQAQHGMNLYQLGRLAEAERALRAAKSIDPRHPSLPQLFLAEIHARRGEKASAISEIEELLAARPDAQLERTLRATLARLR